MRTFPIIKETETLVFSLTSKRICGECTACCTYTSREVFGETYQFGVPCKYLDKQCTIYESRPVNPCQGFACSWLHSPHMIPDWLRPDLSNVMLINRVGYLAAIICDTSKEYERAIKWLINFSEQKKCNITINIGESKCLAYGDPKWVDTRNEISKKDLGENNASD